MRDRALRETYSMSQCSFCKYRHGGEGCVRTLAGLLKKKALPDDFDIASSVAVAQHTIQLVTGLTCGGYRRSWAARVSWWVRKTGFSPRETRRDDFVTSAEIFLRKDDSRAWKVDPRLLESK